jgi:NitT/TauT family transport system substrate-binding protein
MLRRRSVLSLPGLALAALALPPAACSKGQVAGGRIQLALDWFPEPEHGGLFAAEVAGDYSSNNLDLELLAGHPDAPVLAQVAAGRVAFGLTDAATLLAARAEQVPVVAVFAALQQNPRCILVHADGPKTLAELSGLTVAMNVREPFSQFLRRQVGLKDIAVVPYSGNVAPFLADPRLAQQAYAFSEPLVVARAGVAARCLMVADLGFNPYAGVVITSERLLADRPELARRLVAAVTRGWERYLQDPAPANARIHERNPQMDPDTLTRSAAAVAPLVAVAGSGRPGAMTLARWQTLDQQLTSLGVYPEGALDPAAAFTLDALPT